MITSTPSDVNTDKAYAQLERLLAEKVAGNRRPLFNTTADVFALWSTYINSFPVELRQHYNCHTCRDFIQRYGGLVAIEEDGTKRPLLWDIDLPEPFEGVVTAMHRLVWKNKVVGVFRWNERQWGVATTEDVKRGCTWTHLHGVAAFDYHDQLKTPGQQMAECREEYAMLNRGLADYPLEVLQQAVRVLDANALFRAEKSREMATWLFDLHTRRNAVRGEVRQNITWLAVATAPVGFAHFRTTILGTLLDDIKAGLPFEAISQRWRKKVDPLQYQRPQTPPRMGHIATAEKVFAELGLGPALKRRYATIEDIQQFVWRPTPAAPEQPATSGLFGHLLPDTTTVRVLELPPTLITWEKFREKVLPTCLEMEVMVPVSGWFYGLTAASDPDAPPLLQWDGLEGFPRNSLSWYFYSPSSTATQWGLRANIWTPVNGIFLSPHQWHEPEKFQHHKKHAFFIINGAQEQRAQQLALFPETMRNELHAVRAVVEAYSNSASLEGRTTGTANGLAFQEGVDNQRLTVRVRSSGGLAVYTLDRWE